MVQAGYKPDLVRLAVTALRSSLKAALVAGVLSANPVSAVSLPRGRPHEMHPLTVEQIEALAEAISHPEQRPEGRGVWGQARQNGFGASRAPGCLHGAASWGAMGAEKKAPGSGEQDDQGDGVGG